MVYQYVHRMQEFYSSTIQLSEQLEECIKMWFSYCPLGTVIPGNLLKLRIGPCRSTYCTININYIY